MEGARAAAAKPVKPTVSCVIVSGQARATRKIPSKGSKPLEGGAREIG